MKIHFIAGICLLMQPLAGGFRNISREEAPARNRANGNGEKFRQDGPWEDRFPRKPFRLDVLLRKVREVLDE